MELRHTAPVRLAEWRPRADGAAALLTVTEDGLVRVWEETGTAEPLGFFVATVLPERVQGPARWLVASESTDARLEGDDAVVNDTDAALDDTDGAESHSSVASSSDFFGLSTDKPASASEPLLVARARRRRPRRPSKLAWERGHGHSVADERWERLAATQDVPLVDWVVCVARETGHMRVWVLQGIGASPRRVCQVDQWAVLPDTPVGPGAAVLSVASPADMWSGSEDYDFEVPVAVEVICLSAAHDMLSQWQINLAPALQHVSTLASVSFPVLSGGHSLTIGQLIAHPHLPVLASFDDERVCFWRTRAAGVIDPPNVLDFVTAVHGTSLRGAWAPNHLGMLFLASGDDDTGAIRVREVRKALGDGAFRAVKDLGVLVETGSVVEKVLMLNTGNLPEAYRGALDRAEAESLPASRASSRRSSVSTYADAEDEPLELGVAHAASSHPLWLVRPRVVTGSPASWSRHTRTAPPSHTPRLRAPRSTPPSRRAAAAPPSRSARQ